MKDNRYEEIKLYLDQKGDIKVGTSGGCLGRIEDDRFIAEKQGPDYCRVALQDSEGTLWIGSYGTTPALYYYKDGHFHASDMAGIETVAYVSALCDYEGTLWIGTANGLFSFDYRSQQVRRFTADQGDLSVNSILALVADPEQECLWIGTSGGGVLKYDSRGFQSIRLGKSTLENIVEAILPDSRGRLWFGMRAGLIAYQPGLSQRRGHPFVALNCGSLPTGLIESELFGHERGSFTGAVKRHIGCFERANYGTLFLDEIGDLSLEVQQALLRILENRYLTRVGGEQSIPVDVRVIAATNKDLKQAIRAGTFREDLFYRLSVWPVKLPPLRERREDIPVLAADFARRYAQSLQRPVPALGDGVVKHLQAYAWPGNVRELEHLIRRAVVLCRGEVIQVEDVPLAAEDEATEGPLEPPAAAPVEAEFKAEKQQIVEALQATEGKIYGERGAARLLGMNPERLRSRMRVFGLQRPKKGL